MFVCLYVQNVLRICMSIYKMYCMFVCLYIQNVAHVCVSVRMECTACLCVYVQNVLHVVMCLYVKNVLSMCACVRRCECLNVLQGMGVACAICVDRGWVGVHA